MNEFRFDTRKEVGEIQDVVAKPAKAANESSSNTAPQAEISSFSNLSCFGSRARTPQPPEGPHELAEEFGRTGRIRLESDWAGVVWLVASPEQIRGDEDGSVYFPDEVRFMVRLRPRERRLLHGFKREFGATIEPRRDDATERTEEHGE